MDKLRLRPTPSRIIVLVEEPEESTGTFDTSNIKTTQVFATIQRCGSAIPDNKNGDRIIIGENAGIPFEFEDIEYKLIYVDDIYATVEE
jgi:co-chaperonin GroES (HSP10)